MLTVSLLLHASQPSLTSCGRFQPMLLSSKGFSVEPSCLSLPGQLADRLIRQTGRYSKKVAFSASSKSSALSSSMAAVASMVDCAGPRSSVPKAHGKQWGAIPSDGCQEPCKRSWLLRMRRNCTPPAFATFSHGMFRHNFGISSRKLAHTMVASQSLPDSTGHRALSLESQGRVCRPCSAGRHQ